MVLIALNIHKSTYNITFIMSFSFRQAKPPNPTSKRDAKALFLMARTRFYSQKAEEFGKLKSEQIAVKNFGPDSRASEKIWELACNLADEGKWPKYNRTLFRFSGSVSMGAYLFTNSVVQNIDLFLSDAIHGRLEPLEIAMNSIFLSASLASASACFSIAYAKACEVWAVNKQADALLQGIFAMQKNI